MVEHRVVVPGVAGSNPVAHPMITGGWPFYGRPPVILLADDAGPELKAQYPLREGRVDVTEVAGKPGVFNAVVFLKPHFQLEELTTSILLVAELPAPAS